MNGIKPDYRINRLQTPGTPCLYFRKCTVGDRTDCLGRYTVAEVLFHPVAYFTCAVTQDIKSDDAVCNTLGKNGLTLLYKLRSERGIAVTRRRYGHFTHGGLHLLQHLPITTVATHTFILGKMGIHLSF